MKILLTGATGFIGSALVDRLRTAGHDLRLVVRRPAEAARRWPGLEAVAIDFNAALEAGQWREAVEGVDAVVNAVGIIRETREQRFRILHVDAPVALFEAAAKAGIDRVIQISALGADADAFSAYHLSKFAADKALLALHPRAAIVQPSLVFGLAGASARQFLRMAALPVIPLPGAGLQQVQPIHVDDLCDCVSELMLVSALPTRIAAVGPECSSFRDYLQALRSALGAGRAHWLQVPVPLMRLLARIGDRWPGASFDSDRLGMLERGNCADTNGIAALLGRLPRHPRQFIPAAESGALLRDARMDNGLGLLKLAIAIVWIVSGVVSLGLWPIEDSLSLLARCGLSGPAALVALYGSAALDIGLGVGTLVMRGRMLGRLYMAQIGLILAYTLLVAIFLPEFLLHPFAPIAKNLPMLAALVLLRWGDRR